MVDVGLGVVGSGGSAGKSVTYNILPHFVHYEPRILNVLPWILRSILCI